MSAPAFVSPTELTAPVADTTAGKWQFGAPVRTITVTNTSGQTAYVKINSPDDPPSATYGDFDFSVATGSETTIGPNELGGVTVEYVGIWFPAAATVANHHTKGI